MLCNHRFCCLLILLVTVSVIESIKVSDGMSSFASAQKEGFCSPGQETVLFSHTPEEPGIITEQWFSGSDCYDNTTLITYYIDDDPELTLRVNLFMLIGDGIGILPNKSRANSPNDKPYWATRRLGHVAVGGAYFTTIRIPFQRSVVVTLQTLGKGRLWFLLRGMQNYPLIIGDLELPQNSKLRLYKNVDRNLQPLEHVLLAHSFNTSGLVYLVTLIGRSKNFVYLEGCFRILIDGRPIQYLSSGTEDFFLSAYYYNTGLYHMYHAGLSRKDNPGTMSAYKFFEDDPLLFQKSMSLIWRCGEADDNHCFPSSRGDELCTVENERHLKCISTVGPPKVDQHGFYNNDGENDLFPTRISSYVWVYEW